MLLPQIAVLMLAAAVSTGTAPAPAKSAPEPVTDNDVARAIANAGGGLKNLPYPTDADIAKSIEKAKDWLLAQQKKDGLWPEEAGPDKASPGDTTAIAFDAVLVCGMYPHPFYENKQMAAALDSLVAAQPEETQAVALRVMALARAVRQMSGMSPKRDATRLALVRDAQRLINAQAKSGGWGPKSLAGGEGEVDFRDTVCALRALDVAARVGVQVCFVWQKALPLLYKMQQPDGSWNDSEDKTPGSTPAATAAGAECLGILASNLDLWSGCPCKSRQSATMLAESEELQKRLESAMDWLSKEFPHHLGTVYTAEALKIGTPEERKALLAEQAAALGARCAVERAAIATGSRNLGGHDWYKGAAERILECQGADGSWGDVASTALAVTFLREGRTTPVIGKLRIAGARWNSHPRDVAYLCAYIYKSWCMSPADWQVVDIDAPLEEMHEAPVLFLSLDSVPKINADQKKKLRAYTDTGGTILLEAVCGNPEVRAWAEKFFAEVWPEWKLKALPADHKAFLEPVALKTQRPELMGIDDGVATRVFYSPDDISCAWQTRSVASKEYLFKFMVNLVRYASDGRAIRPRLWAPEPPKPATAAP